MHTMYTAEQLTLLAHISRAQIRSRSLQAIGGFMNDINNRAEVPELQFLTVCSPSSNDLKKLLLHGSDVMRVKRCST